MEIYRAITLGPGDEDWAVVDHRGRVVFQGIAQYAARMAHRMNLV
jgi:hypothetical protein